MGKEFGRESEEMDELELLLRRALVPAEEPDDRLNQQILNSAVDGSAAGRDLLRRNETLQEKNCRGRLAGKVNFRCQIWRSGIKGQILKLVPGGGHGGVKMKRNRMETERNRVEKRGMDNRKMRRLPAVALGVAIMVGAGSLTAYGAYRYLTLNGAVEELGDMALVEAFGSDCATVINETQSYGGYNVTLMGIASGENLSKRVRINEGVVRSDRTYAMVAIARSDGAPMPDFAEPGEEDTGRDFFVSPLIGGYDPAVYNAASMRGNYSEMLLDGVVYRLLECDNVEIFADHELYLCVIGEHSFYDNRAYSFDGETGRITRNPAYQGLNALFRLPVDAGKADPEKAGEYLAELGLKPGGSVLGKDTVKTQLEDGFTVEAENGNEKGAEAAEYALQFLGNPYVWGGESLTEGCDSSGFTKGVYGHFGISLPHAAAQQKDYGAEVDGLEAARPGDLIFYEDPSHVAVYIGGNRIVHADTQNGICVSEADFAEPMTIRRMF